MLHNPGNFREINRTIASMVVISADDKILLGRKDQARGGVYPDAWHLPGGGVNEGESLEHAARRELLEETGIDLSNQEIKQLPHIGKGDASKTLPSGEKVWCNMIFNRFEGRLPKISKDIALLPKDDLIELRWFDKEQLKHVKLVPRGREFFIEAGYINV